jgi:hypothetical protein
MSLGCWLEEMNTGLGRQARISSRPEGQVSKGDIQHSVSFSVLLLRLQTEKAPATCPFLDKSPLRVYSSGLFPCTPSTGKDTLPPLSL